VAWRWETHNGYAYSEQHYEGEDGQPLYTTPPQRQWVGLTDEERNYIWDVVGNSDAHGDVDGWSGRDVMAALEAKLKEKNT
jgi:hypothetical protein